MNSKRFGLLDMIKGVMIVFIIVTHFRFVYPEDYIKYGFFFWIDMAVPVFMIVSGYLAAIQFEKKEITSLYQALSVEMVIPKLLRFIVPFSIAMLIEVPVLAMKKNSIIEIIRTIVSGGVGPGSYYTPIMIQFIFVMPFVYFLIKKYEFFGCCISFVLTGLWELVQYSCGMDSHSYALIFFRYISMVAFGCYVAIGRRYIKTLVLVIMFSVGFLWQYLLNYVPLYPKFMNYAWARVNYIPALFVMPILYVLINKYKDFNIKGFILKELGKASYNVYLVQMVFYGVGSGIVYKFVKGTCLQLCVCIFLCSVVGILFYKIENRITKRIINFVKDEDYFRTPLYRLSDKCNSLVEK